MLRNAISPAFLPSHSPSSPLTQLRRPALPLPLLTVLEIPPLVHHFQHHSHVSRTSLAPGIRSHPAASAAPSMCTQDETYSGKLFALFGEIGLDEKEAEFILIQNSELRMKSFYSLHDRIELLQSVGIDGLDLYQLIVKCPVVLTAEEIDPFICFLRDGLDGKIHALQIKRTLMATAPKFLVGFDEKVNLLMSGGVPKEKMIHVLDNVNLSKALCMRPMEEIERFLEYMDRFGCLDLIVRRPVILNFDLDRQLIPRIEYIVKLSGGDRVASGNLLRKRPAILSYSMEHVQGHAELLRSFAGLGDDEIFRIFVVFPNVISASKERKLRPRISFLKECGLNSREIFKFLSQAPLFLGLSFEWNLAHKLGILVKLGYGHRTKELAVAMGAVTRTSCENLQKVVDLFLSYRLSCEDIVTMSKKHPQMLQYNPESLEEKVEYLMGEMGRGMEELLAFPAFLGYKLDTRIKHRYEVKKKITGEGMSLNKLLSISVEKFDKITKDKVVI